MKNLNTSSRRHKMRPPYDCPVCCTKRVFVKLEEEKTVFHVKCACGKFEQIVPAKPALEQIDAYNSAIDMI